MNLTANSIAVLEKRYYKKDEVGNVLEDWKGMITRVAKNISGGDRTLFKKFYQLLDSGAFLPNSPTLMNAGNDLQQLSACFVLPIDDSLESIFNSVKNAALIHKSGGGTGFSFSRLREANCRVKTTTGVSSGPISFLRVFNAATDAVKQGGTRRGANMAILSVNHPQILEFIKCKENTKDLTNFNLSVAITEDFMNAVQQDAEYHLISPHTNKIHSKLKARDVWTMIVEMAHKNGEPGLIFIDRINQHNPTPNIGSIESTNPCGEQPLLPNEACNLGSINLLSIYKDKSAECGVRSAEFGSGDFQSPPSIDLRSPNSELRTPNSLDWDYLKDIVRDSVDFLDCVIDKSKFPLTEIENMVKANRKIGLGIMGWAELLYKLQIPYNSDKAIDLAEEIMEFIDYHGKERSMELAIEKGSFPNFKGSIYQTGSLKRQTKKKDWKNLINQIKKNGIRNATITTIAPTGTISMICNTSSGIEPQFSLVYIKQVMDGEKLLYVNEVFQNAVQKYFDNPEKIKAIMEQIADAGSLAHISQLPDALKKVFVTSHEIPPQWHIKMQAAFQKYTDNAVSKTINFPNSATLDDVQIAFETAFKLGCKGITVYRDGSRENQVLNVGKKTSENRPLESGDLKSPLQNSDRVAPRLRPEITSGITQRIETGCGHLYVTINCDDRGPCEVFTQMGKVGGCASAQLEALARLTSMSLRANVELESVIRQLKGIRCPNPMWNKGKMITSCADAIAMSLQTFLAVQDKGIINGTIKIDEIHKFSETKTISNQTCPDCGCTVEHSEGCMKCPSCGWSKC